MSQTAPDMMVQQGEGGTAVKSRRNGARLFKNPPQPHMCIQDYIQGSWDPCYINVLSWGKIAIPHRPSEPVPLWGGMKVNPPRTEKPQCAVFAVMANPEILRLNGKNAQDPQQRSALIDLLLDFVEAMNEGVVFTRCYTVLKDRDITGELKEVWMAVQMKRDREQETQQETWIDVQPPAPQYPQFEMTPEYSYQTSGDHVYQSGGPIVTQQYHGNVPPQITRDQYNYGERGRQQSPTQNLGQQNCPAYPTPQYQFQQLPRQLVPQYINPNIHPNVNPGYSNPNVLNSNVNPNIPGHYQQYIALQQQMVGQRQLENVMHAVRETHTDVQQQQQHQPPPMHVPHMQSMLQYEQPPPFSLQTSSPVNVLRLGRPHMGVTQKSNANKKQTNQPMHPQPISLFWNRKSAVAQQSETSEWQNAPAFSPENSKGGATKNSGNNETEDAENVQVTDLDEELEVRGDGTVESKSAETNNSPNGQKMQKPVTMTKKDQRQQILNSSDEITVLETDLPLEGTEDKAPNQNLSSKPIKTQILVLKRNSKTTNNDSKVNSKDPKVVKNAIRLMKLEGQQIYDLESDRTSSNKEKGTKDGEEEANQASTESADKICSDNSGKNGFVQHKQQKGRSIRSQAVNNIKKNVFKIHPSTSNDDKGNNQVKSNGTATENDDVYHGYAILRKGETNEDDIMSEIAQISIQDCQDTTEASTVHS